MTDILEDKGAATSYGMPEKYYVSDGHTRQLSESPWPEHWKQEEYLLKSTVDAECAEDDKTIAALAGRLEGVLEMLFEVGGCDNTCAEIQKALTDNAPRIKQATQEAEI